MELKYASEKLKSQCTSMKEAKKLFGGNDMLAKSLMARINALESAEVIKDIIVQPQFRFHSLYDKGDKKLKGFYSIDVKTRKEQWRIILRPLDIDKKPYVNSIDEIADVVEIVEIKEVSKHYE